MFGHCRCCRGLFVALAVAACTVAASAQTPHTISLRGGESMVVLKLVNPGARPLILTGITLAPEHNPAGLALLKVPMPVTVPPRNQEPTCVAVTFAVDDKGAMDRVPGSVVTLVFTSRDGRTWRMPLRVEVASEIPKRHALLQNHPNPFNSSTIIRYWVSGRKSQRVTLTVFNLLGQRVRTLVDEDLAAGRYEVTWDGRDAHGQPVASGVYTYTLEVDRFVAKRRLTVLK